MTTTTAHTPAPTVGEQLARHDATKRTEATRAGHPIERTATTGLFGAAPGRVIYTDARGILRVGETGASTAAPSASHTTKLTPARLAEIVADWTDDAPAVTAFTTRDTLRKTIAAARSWAEEGDADARTLVRQLEFREGLPASVVAPVLTDALTSKFWAPTGMEVKSITEWVHAFQIASAPNSPATFGLLCRYLAHGSTPDRKLTDGLRGGEKYGLQSSKYGSSAAANSAYGLAQKAFDAHAAILATDPLLRDRNMINGIVCQLRVKNVLHGSFTATVSDPFKLREGGEVWLFTQTGTEPAGETFLRGVDFVNDNLLITLDVTNRNRATVEGARSRYEPLYAVTKPIMAFRKSPKNRQWTNRAEASRPQRRDVPADIVLAGAPTE